jgi:hypothetical protein
MMFTRWIAALAFTLLPWFTAEAAAQRRAQRPGAAEGVALSITGEIGGKKYQASGNGTCRHAPDASINGVSASLWMVQYGGSGDAALKQVNLTLWRPKDGASDQLSLNVETKSGFHRIETGGSGENQGEGAVVILPSCPGGRLEISGKDGENKPIKITIDCPAFTAIHAEGG